VNAFASVGGINEAKISRISIVNMIILNRLIFALSCSILKVELA
jgi:hypothetical protein